jgi:hypothetical protein
MKTHLKNIISGAALGLALLANTAPTWAGQALISEVEIGSDYASGSVQATRYSSDQTQYIGCLSYECYAKDIYGAVRRCFVGDSATRAVIRTITDHSHIFFTLKVSQGITTCNVLSINNGSFYLK